MKVALILILALVATSAMTPKKITKAQKEDYVKLRESNGWAGFFVRLAEVQVMTQGPLDELVGAIEDALEELAFKREKADAAFDKRTDEHNAEVQRLEAAIANTEEQISEILDTLELLAEQKADLEEENRTLTQQNADLREHIKEATRVRANQHEAYNTHVEEYEEGIAAVDECLTLLRDLQNGPSLVQVKKVKASLAQVHEKLQKSKSTENHLLMALVEMATNQEFADGGAVATVIAKFEEIRGNLVQSLAQATADEQQAQDEFEADVDESNKTINSNDVIIKDNNDALVVNAANTEENNTMLALRRQDLVDFNQELDDENASYENDKAIYEDLCAQFDSEVEACNLALSVLATADFSDYIADRVTAEDGLVSSGMATATQHGQGTEVFNFDYQL